METNKTTAELIDQHTDIWNLLSLSTGASQELNEIVKSIHTQLQDNRENRPGMVEAADDVQRAAEPMTKDSYLRNHRARFTKLGISDPTQDELIEAASFVWRALHDPSVPESKRAVAEQIQSMMKALGGPPPCCDDNLFARAAKPAE